MRESERAQGLLSEYGSLLEATLSVDDRLDWRTFVGDRPFDVLEPQLADVRQQLEVPAERAVMEQLRPKLRERRELAEQSAASAYERALAGWNEERARHEARTRATTSGRNEVPGRARRRRTLRGRTLV